MAVWALLLFLNALPQGAVLVEGEAFDVESGWYVGTDRAESAPGGLSGGAVLSARTPEARARKSVSLLPGAYTVWARVYDWGGAPGHYSASLQIGDQTHPIATTKPPLGGFLWERWGNVQGNGTLDLVLSRADAFTSELDCLLFSPDPGYVPSSGPEPVLERVSLSGSDLGKPIPIELYVKSIQKDINKQKSVLLLYAQSTKELIWQQDVHWKRSGAGTDAETLHLAPMTIPPQPYLRPGKYILALAVTQTAWNNGKTLAELEKTATEPPKPCHAEIRPYRDKPAIWINDRPEFPYAFLMAAGDFDREYQHFADTGGRFFSCDAPIGNGKDGFNPAGCDGPFLRVLRHQPSALIFPRVDVTAPAWWLEEHPGQAVVFEDGGTGPQSMFSESWLKDACDWIETYARYLRTSPYADHIIGIHICSGYTGEWQSWGLWDDRRSDFSDAAKAAWAHYLAEKYGTDAALAEAWGRAVTLASAELPSRARRETPTDFQRMPKEHQDIIDFYDYYWRGTAKAIQALAAAAKRGGGRDFLTGFFYGYAVQYGGKAQESQHLGMREVLTCPDIDFFCSPAMYSRREPGGTSTFMSFTESIQAHGKFWWDEADNRTYLAKDTLARAGSLGETLNVMKREFSHVVTRQAGMWWFDMGGGWFDHPAMRTLFRQQRAFAESNPGLWRPKTEMAIFVDDKSSYRIAPESPFLNDSICQLLSDMPRLGAPYDTYLLADLDKAQNYKFCLFLNAFDLDDGEREAIDGLKRDGRTLMFIGPAGVGRCKRGQVEHNPEFSSKLRAPGEGETAFKVVWTMHPKPALSELRAIAREAGVHLYSDRDDALYAGNGLIAVHGNGEGARTLHFTEDVVLHELFSEKPFEWRGRELSYPLRARETRCFSVTPVSQEAAAP